MFLVDVSFSMRWFSKISKHIEQIWNRKPLAIIHILAVVSFPYSTISDRLNPQTLQKATTWTCLNQIQFGQITCKFLNLKGKKCKNWGEIPNIWGDWSPAAPAPSTNSSAVLAAPWMAGNLGRCSHQVSDWSRGDQTFHPLRLVGGHGWYITPFLKRSPLQTIPKKAHGDSQNCQVQIYTLLQPPSDPQPSHREDKGGSYHSEWHIFVGEEFKHPNLGGGWFTKPLDKYMRVCQIGSWNPNFPGENKKHLKPPPCYLNLKHFFGTSRDDSDHMISMPSLLGNM